MLFLPNVEMGRKPTRPLVAYVAMEKASQRRQARLRQGGSVRITFRIKHKPD